MGRDEGKIAAVTLRRLREIQRIKSQRGSYSLGPRPQDGGEGLKMGERFWIRTRIEQTVRVYGFTFEDFLLCREGKSEQIKKKILSQKRKDCSLWKRSPISQ